MFTVIMAIGFHPHNNLASKSFIKYLKYAFHLNKLSVKMSIFIDNSS